MTWLSSEDHLRNGSLLSEQLDKPQGPLLTDTIDAISKALNLGADGIWGNAISKSLAQVVFWVMPGQSSDQARRWMQLTAYTYHNVLFMYSYLSAASQASTTNVYKLANTNPFTSGDGTAFLKAVVGTLAQFPTTESATALKKYNLKSA